MRENCRTPADNPVGPYAMLSDGVYLAGVIRGVIFLAVVGVTLLAILSTQSIVRSVVEYQVEPPATLSASSRTTCMSVPATHEWVCNTSSN